MTVIFFQSAVLLALLVVFLPACANQADEPAAAEAGTPRIVLPVEKFPTSQDGEMDHFVAALDEELFIGVAVAGQDGDDEAPRTVAVYLCDGQMVSQWITGEITGEEGTLVAGESSAEVTIADDGVSGTVALDGGQPRPFTAEPADNDAGVYRAKWSQGGADYHVDWVILNDGRQRGALDGKGNDVIVLDPN